MTKRIIVVLGMHRSGTSAVTRGLLALGVNLGDNLLTAAHDDNEKGFWEDLDILSLNDALLKELGHDWQTLVPIISKDYSSDRAKKFKHEAVSLLQSKTADNNVFGLKDPRLARLLPFWQEVFNELNAQVGYVIVCRNPLSVACSLQRRNRFPAEKSHLLWLEHMLSAVQLTQGQKRVVVDYDLLLDDPQAQLHRIASQLGLYYDKSSPEYRNYVTEFLEKSLRHSRFEGADLASSPEMPCYVKELYSLLSDLARGRVVPDHQIYSVTGQVEAYMLQVHPLMKYLSSQDSELQSLTGVVDESRRQYDSLSQKIQEREDRILILNRELKDRDQKISNLQQHISSLDQHISGLDLHISWRDQQISELDRHVSELEQHSSALEQHIQMLSADINDILHSKSWRLTSPLRWLMGLVRKFSGCAQSFWSYGLRVGVYIRRKPSCFARGLAYLSRYGLRGATKRCREVMTPENIQSLNPQRIFNIHKDSLVYILTTPHCRYVGQLIANCLGKVGVSSELIYEKPKNGFVDTPHFVICPQMFKELPNLYVAFQMEQSVSSRWFDKAYFTKLENSFAIFDYSSVNIEFLQKNGLSSRQIYYMPLSFLPDYMPQTINEDEQSYDVLFYGDIYNNRRRCFIDRLSARFSVNVINDLFGDELHAEMRKAKIVVNIHYYEGALLETTRIYECLSAGKLVVSEKSADQQEYTELDGIVDFVEIDDIDEMIKRVEFWLSDDRLRVEKIEDNRRLLTENPNLFVYYFMRFLLASENLDFDQFYKVAGPQITFDNDFICLGLPESIERRRDFEKDNHYGIEYFPALKHRLGWVGCGLSYKFIMKKALEQGLDTITVCEDDVEFFEGWSEQLEVIRKYLFSNMDEWDVFSGLIALLSDDVSVEKIEKLKNIEFIHIDRLISMVFNIYNNNVFKYIIDWDEQDHDANKNTIDKFLEKSSCVKVVTKLPFLVGHKNDLSSTLWGFKNEKYIDLIEKSSVRLAEKVELYKLNKSTDAVVEQKSASEIF